MFKLAGPVHPVILFPKLAGPPHVTSIAGLVLFFFPAAWGVAETAPSPVLLAAREELTRSMKKLEEQPVPPYYLSYEPPVARP